MVINMNSASRGVRNNNPGNIDYNKANQRKVRPYIWSASK